MHLPFIFTNDTFLFSSYQFKEVIAKYILFNTIQQSLIDQSFRNYNGTWMLSVVHCLSLM